ncbi:MAG: penicillin-binding protein 1C [Bacteroidales bacterium]|nr:penicillin-binding protein 1C [Bacteroidales bacterium]
MRKIKKKKKITAFGCAAFLAAFLLIIFLPRQIFDKPVSALLESSDGRMLGARIASDGQWRFPQIDTVPEKFARAIITYEDKRFRYHLGVDPLAVARAILLNLRNREIRSGASTITMQTIRLSRENRPRTVGEKIIEMGLAVRLELRYSKRKILAMYASNAPFGGNVVGLEAASWRYFGRPAGELSWAESAMLAVLPNSPALIHPGKNRDILLEKRNRLLDKMAAKGIIDDTECMLSKEEPLPDKPYPMPNIAYHYLETLRKEGGDRRYASDIDKGLQERTEEILHRHIGLFESNQVYNIAALVMEVSSGRIITYCGNLNPERGGASHGRAVDVIQAPRSSGSTLKPFLYAAMLDDGEILPTMLVPDIPSHYKDFTPSNYNHTFDGAVPANSIIRRSLNVPSVRLLQEYGVEKFLLLMKEMGFTTISRSADDYGLSLILGGAEIKLIDLVRAYRDMAVTLTEPEEGSSPLSPGAIWCTFDALTGVNRPEEEGSWQSFSSSRKVAWKTGTSYGNRDAWSVGVTPEYVVGVWVGNCNGEGRPNLTGIGYAAPVMFEILSILPPTGWFEIPILDLEEVVVCPLSGHPLSDICCIGTGLTPDTLLVPPHEHKPDICPYHRLIHLSEDQTYIVNSDCYSTAKMVTRSWFVLPPSQEWYYMAGHPEYRRLPPLHPNFASGGSSSRGNIVEIIYPQPGMTLAAPLSLDGKSQGVVFSAAHAIPSATLYWHIDDRYIGSTSSNEHKMLIIPEPGRHRLVVTDTNGNSASVWFEGAQPN